MFKIIWTYEVSTEHRTAFSMAYGADGVWAKLFAKSQGYLGTELWTRADSNASFMTIDTWQDEADFIAFQAKYEDEYTRLDKELENLTLSEVKVGTVFGAVKS